MGRIAEVWNREIDWLLVLANTARSNLPTTNVNPFHEMGSGLIIGTFGLMKPAD